MGSDLPMHGNAVPPALCSARWARTDVSTACSYRTDGPTLPARGTMTTWGNADVPRNKLARV